MWRVLDNVNPAMWFDSSALPKMQTYQTNNDYSPTITVEAPVYVDGMMTDRRIMKVLEKHSYDVADMVARRLRR